MTDRTWRKKDGTVILFTDMSDNHLVNSLRLMKRAATKQAAKEGKETEWRAFLGRPAGEKVNHMETECVKRGICWDLDGDIRGKGKLSEKKLSAKSAACMSCRLSLVCFDKKFVARKCPECGRCFVTMGGKLRDQFVHPDCPRRVIRNGGRSERKCYECSPWVP